MSKIIRDTAWYCKRIMRRVASANKAIDAMKQQIINDREQGLLKHVSEYDFESSKCEHALENLIQELAWCHDQIVGIKRVIYDVYNHPRTKEMTEYRRSWTYKVRKALGYTYP